MKYQTITDFNRITEAEWDNTLAESKTNAPFLHYGFQRAWWAHLGGGEWKNAALRIIGMYQDDSLLGIAPLFVSEINGSKELHFIGSFEIADYLDFIVPPEMSEEFIREVLRISVNDPDFSADRIVLYNIPDDSPSITALKKIAEDGEWQVQIENAYHTPAIKLAEDWDTYLESIDKKQRHEIRRKMRRAESSEEDAVSWHIIGAEDDLEQAIVDFTALMEHDPDKAKFLSPAMREQMAEIIRWAAQAGILQLSFLKVNETQAAAYLCFNDADRIWVYNSGFSPGFGYYSPGWVLLGYLIQHAIKTSKSYFDFMRGDEEYKYRFGAEDSFVMKAVIQRQEP